MTSRDEPRYPKLLRVPRVPDDAWLSQPQAARQLGIALFRIGVLIACGHLTPAENSAWEGRRHDHQRAGREDLARQRHIPRKNPSSPQGHDRLLLITRSTGLDDYSGVVS